MVPPFLFCVKIAINQNSKMAYVKQEYKKDVRAEIILYLSLATGEAIFGKLRQALNYQNIASPTPQKTT